MNRLKQLIAALTLALPASAMAATIPAQLYKSPSCGCCAAYADYLREEGYAVEVIARDDMSQVKAQHGVPQSLASCHTTLIGNYVVEGHVPAESIDKLLAERPLVTGITAPGMPMGSPGMGGDRREPLKVYYISGSAQPQVHAVH